MFFDNELGLDREDIEKNVDSQASQILKDLVNAYEKGLLDDPSAATTYCALLACVCEGKVAGSFDGEDDEKVVWSITDEYKEVLKRIEDDTLEEGIASGKIIKGPWPQDG